MTDFRLFCWSFLASALTLMGIFGYFANQDVSTAFVLLMAMIAGCTAVCLRHMKTILDHLG